MRRFIDGAIVVSLCVLVHLVYLGCSKGGGGGGSASLPAAEADSPELLARVAQLEEDVSLLRGDLTVVNLLEGRVAALEAQTPPKTFTNGRLFGTANPFESTPDGTGGSGNPWITHVTEINELTGERRILATVNAMVNDGLTVDPFKRRVIMFTIRQDSPEAFRLTSVNIDTGAVTESGPYTNYNAARTMVHTVHLLFMPE